MVVLGIPWPVLRGPLRNHFWKWGVPSCTGGERILEMLWNCSGSPQMPWTIGFRGCQPYWGCAPCEALLCSRPPSRDLLRRFFSFQWNSKYGCKGTVTACFALIALVAWQYLFDNPDPPTIAFFWRKKKQGKPTKKARFFPLCGTPKILEKKENTQKKQRKSESEKSKEIEKSKDWRVRD